MVTKNLYLIFLISALLSTNYLVKAMENPNKKPKYEDQSLGDENEDDTSLKIEDENKASSSGENLTLNDIDQHCAFLEQFKKEEKLAFLNVNEKTLDDYKKLLKIIFVKHHPDLDNILFIFNKHFQHLLKSCNDGYIYDFEKCITLKNVNALLVAFMYCCEKNDGDKTMPDRIKWALNQITYAAFSGYSGCSHPEYYADLCWLLAKNDLLPALDYIFNIYDCHGDNKNFLCLLLRGGDAKLFGYIIQKTKNKDKDYWISLFNSQVTENKGTVLHWACNNDGHVLELVLSLMKEKGLDLDNFMFVLDDRGESPIDSALFCPNYDAMSVLINKGEEREEPNSLKYIAASKVVECPNWMNLMENVPQELQEYCNLIAKIYAYNPMVKPSDDRDYYIYLDEIRIHKELFIKLFNKEFSNLNLILNIVGNNFQNYCDACNGDTEDIDEYINRIGLIEVILLAMINKCMALEQSTSLDKVDVMIEQKIVNRIRQEKYADISLLLVLGNLSLNYIFDIKDLFCLGINGTYLKTTVLHAAAMYASRNVFITLLNIMQKNDCDVNYFLNIQDGNGMTPLMIAASRGNLEIIELLLDCKVDANIKYNNGLTALDYLEKYLEQSSYEKREEFAKVIGLLRNAANNCESDLEKKEVEAKSQSRCLVS